MKTLLLIALASLASAVRLAAQTNTGFQLPGSSMVITSRTGIFELQQEKKAFFIGHVRVDDPRMKLTCQWMQADLVTGSGHVNHIDCRTNVVIDFLDDKGQTNHATGDRAVYLYHVEGTATNETITLTGHPEVDTAEARTTGDKIVWDRVTGKVLYDNPVIVPRRNLLGTPAATNSPPSRTATNLPARWPQETNSTPAITNVAPGLKGTTNN